MKNKKLITGVILILGISLIAFFLLRKGSRSDQMDTSSAKGEQRKILYYKSPMRPDFISEKPGKDPMGMDLIPVYEGDEPLDSGIRIEPATVQNIGVKTAVVTKRNLIREIRTVGRITYDERKIAYINTKVDGWIEKLYVDYVGQNVKEGDRLLEIYSPDLVSTQEEFLLALEYNKMIEKSSNEKVRKRALSLLEASRRRLEYWDIPEVHIELLEKTGQVNKSLMIHSPVTGVVIEKTVLEGKFAKAGEDLYKIADLSRVWVYADIYEYELPWVRNGQEVEMSLSYLPGKVFMGKISYLYPYLESKTRTVKVRIEYDNPDGELKPDMYADVKINTSPRKSVLAVPKEAVILSGVRKVIIIDKGKGFFEPRDIQVGFETKDYYEVIDGIKEGENVVISSQFLIDSESRLSEAISKMLKVKKEKTTEK
jgi:RND family efflux transporter MFP subunit